MERTDAELLNFMEEQRLLVNVVRVDYVAVINDEGREWYGASLREALNRAYADYELGQTVSK